MLVFGTCLDASLYFVGDMRNHLNGLAKIVASTPFLDYSLIDSTCRETVVSCGLDICEPFVMAEV